MHPRILVVDDDEAVRTVVTQLLRRDGCEVDVAGDGQQALERMREGAVPEVLLVDLIMPAMTGWALIDAMAKTPSLAKVPVVVMTSLDCRIDLPPGRVVLHKPIEPDVLLDRLHAALA